MKTIIVEGHQCFVDDIDYEMLIQYNWHLYRNKRYKTFYAYRSLKINGKWTSQQMHRLILGVCDRSIHVDHKNGNGLDNQKDNLRQCTHAENCRNKRPYGGRSKYIGVHEKDGRFNIVITINRKQIREYGFTDEIEAAKRRDELSIKYHGEFASLNFSKTTEVINENN